MQTLAGSPVDKLRRAGLPLHNPVGSLFGNCLSLDP